MVMIAGVVILIIAVAGIVYHEKTYEKITPEEKKTSYRIEWDEGSDEIALTDYVGRDGWSKNYTIDEGEDAFISYVEFVLEWQDNLDFHGFILPWNWSDKIEMSVSIPQMSFSSTNDGYKKIRIVAERNVPESKIVKAINKTEAMNMIDEKTGKINCQVDLSIFPKPRFFDKGNDFELSIIYHYYKPSVEEIK